LIKAGRNLNEEDRDTGRELPLIIAMRANRPDILELLLKAGSVITDTAAIETVLPTWNDRHDKLRRLLSFGLDPNRQYARHDLI
jgi:hypothetical protein